MSFRKVEENTSKKVKQTSNSSSKLQGEAKTRRLRKEGRTVDAWPLVDEEGRTKRRNAAGSCKEAKIRRYPNGETRHIEKSMSSITESIGYERETRGTETSKYPEEKKTNVIP